MRLKNVKGAKGVIESSKYIIMEPEKYRENWKSLFNNDNDIRLEIGMGKGDFIINSALKYPNVNFIGIEKFDSVIVRAIQKLEHLEIPNLKLIRMDALNIENVFNKEISCLYLNFSDPWPKERHANRRLTSSIFLSHYDKIFKDNRIIIMKTDNRGLFEYSLKTVVNYGYKIDDISLDLYNSDLTDNVQTEYEKKFSANGDIIYRATFIKKD